MDASALLLRELAPGVESVEIENRIQYQRVRPARFASIHRIDRKQHHVALARGHVQNCGMLCDLIAAFDQAGDQQIFAVGVTQNDPRASCRRDDTISVALLLVTHRRIFPKLGTGASAPGRPTAKSGSSTVPRPVGREVLWPLKRRKPRPPAMLLREKMGPLSQ